VVPIFQEQLRAGDVLTLTHPAMTRFLMTLDDAVELALRALDDGMCGYGDEAPTIWVKKAPSCTVEALAEACIRLYGRGRDGSARDIKRKIIGIRPGEKMHECLVGAHEMMFATELDAKAGAEAGAKAGAGTALGYYMIKPGVALESSGMARAPNGPELTWRAYTSDEAVRLGVDEVVAMLERAEKE
jgi:hypothetical protein